MHALHNAVAAAVVLGSGAVGLPTSAAAAQSQQAPAAASSPTERYFVQVSAQRGELQARLSFHLLQLRYPAVLAERPLVIRRTDTTLGPWYRALAGPFDTAAEATRVCSALKTAGGQCIVIAEPRS